MIRRKYFICKGNNSILIMRSFKTRSGWSPAKGPDSADFVWSQYSKKALFALNHSRQKPRSLNHLIGNSCLVTKNGLYNSLREYHERNNTDLWRSVPVTFHLMSGIENEEKQRFLRAAAESTDSTKKECESGSNSENENEGKDKNLNQHQHLQKQEQLSPKYWIVKPASATNRGVGIRVFDNVHEVLKLVDKYHHFKQKEVTEQKEEGAGEEEEEEEEEESSRTLTKRMPGTTATKKIIKEQQQSNNNKQNSVKNTANKKKKTKRAGHREWVVQRYIHNPLLYKDRKFDIRVFVLLITRGGGKRTECYVFNDGYLRTSSKKWSLDPKKLSDSLMHLTNDGIQCKSEGQYGKHEEGNKLSYGTFDAYLSAKSPEKRGALREIILPRIKELVAESIDATHTRLNPKNRSHCFELLGYDFMVDEDLKTYLIEINSNPCLEDWSCPLLRGMLPVLIDRVLTKVTGKSSASTTTTHRLQKNEQEREALAEAARARYTVMDSDVSRAFDLVWKTPAVEVGKDEATENMVLAAEDGHKIKDAATKGNTLDASVKKVTTNNGGVSAVLEADDDNNNKQNSSPGF